jgi:hypothetical protein
VATADAGGTDAPADAPPADLAPDVRLEPSGRPLPPGVAPARRLLPPVARLTGSGKTTCSHQDPPSGDGDRWCVFTVPGVADRSELWVVDVTRAALDKPPPCDGSSSLCLRLTSNLWTATVLDGPVHPYSHEFHGDTLIFYADSVTSPDDLYHGRVFAWRPGWAQARQISTDKGVVCWGHERAAIAYCLEDVAGNPLKPDSAELRAGPLAETATFPMPSIARFRPIRQDGVAAWRARFSAKGDVFAISSADPDPAVETLRFVRTSDLGRVAPTEVLRDAGTWEISRDGQRVFFERQEGSDQSALYAADFPSGANVTKVGSKVTGYDLFTASGDDAGIAFITSMGPTRGAFHLLRDPTRPESAVTLFTYTNEIENLQFSSDLRFTAWVDSSFTARIVRNSDYRSCDLNAQPGQEAIDPWFLEGAGLVFWSEASLDDANRHDGYLADPQDCKNKHRYGWGVEFGIPVGDRAVVFGDEADDYGSTITLKYAEISNAREWPTDGPVRIHEQVAGSSVVVVGTKPTLVIFRVVKGGPLEEGTYVFGPTPF